MQTVWEEHKFTESCKCTSTQRADSRVMPKWAFLRGGSSHILPARSGGANSAGGQGCHARLCPGSRGGESHPDSWRGGNPRKARKPGVWRGKTKLGAVWGDGRGPGRGPRTPADVRLSFMAGMSPVVLEVWWPLGSGIARVLEVGRTAGLSSGVRREHRWPRNMSHNPQGLQ